MASGVQASGERVKVSSVHWCMDGDGIPFLRRVEEKFMRKDKEFKGTV